MSSLQKHPDPFALRRRTTSCRFRPRLETCEDRTLPSTCTVTGLGDAGSGAGLQGDLRYCLNLANGNFEPSNVIQFQPGLSGTIKLLHGDLAIFKDLEIDGPGMS